MLIPKIERALSDDEQRKSIRKEASVNSKSERQRRSSQIRRNLVDPLTCREPSMRNSSTDKPNDSKVN